jgi:hypothetical protein
MDNKEPEIKKPEEINDAPMPEEQLKNVVGGEQVSLTFSKIEYTYKQQNETGSD